MRGPCVNFEFCFMFKSQPLDFESAADAEDLEHDQTVFPGSLCQVPSCFHASITHMYWPHSESWLGFCEEAGGLPSEHATSQTKSHGGSTRLVDSAGHIVAAAVPLSDCWVELVHEPPLSTT